MKARVVIFILSIVLTVSLGYAYQKKREADKVLSLAEQFRFEADKQRQHALDAMALSEYRREESDKARMEAEQQKQICDQLRTELEAKLKRK